MYSQITIVSTNAIEALDELKRLQTTLKDCVTRFQTFLENYADNHENNLALESRLEKHNNLWLEYDAIQIKIDAILSLDIQERKIFEENFLQYKR